MDLVTKLQLKEGALCLVNAPAGFAWTGPVAKNPKTAAGVLVFIKNSQELKAFLKPAIDAARRDAIAYIAYPQEGQLGTDLTRENLCVMLQGQRIRPVRQIALDPVWSAIRFRPEE